MYPEPAISRFLTRVLAALLTGLSIMIAGTLATGWQVYQSVRQDTIVAAGNVVTRTDLLLDEAENAAVLARVFLTRPCSSSVRNELNRLAIRFPHLRVISLLQGDQLTCSSFDVPVPRATGVSQHAERRLSLHQGSIITPDIPYLTLLNVFPEGTVVVSMAISHLTDALSLQNIPSPLSLRTGDQVLTEKGEILTVTPGKEEFHLRSGRYPYSMEYARTPVLPFRLLFERGKILLVLFAVLGILVGVLVLRLSFRQPAPYDELAQAVRRQDIVPWYQPVVCSQTGKISGVEVLARWKHRSGVYIPPDVFIPQAEKSGLIIPLTRQLMDRAAADLAPVIGRLPKPFHIAFNISAAHICAGQLTIDDFRHFQSSFPEGSIQLVAEITEREPFTQYPELNELLFGLHHQGIKVALDDFGTGYSNLGYLNTLPVDYIKIDRSFVYRLAEGEESDRLIDCIISMARTLGLGLVAEGVETRYQADWLTAHQVDFWQGYYFSPPLPARGFIRMAILQGRKA